MNALLLLATLASTLVLRSGDRIVADGPIRLDDGVMTFRSAGMLYSLPAEEVERIETQGQPEPTPAAAPERAPETAIRLKVSAEERKRLLAELEKNHGGSPAPRQKILEEITPLPTASERRDERRDESAWRRRARMYEESVLRAREDLALLESRIEELESKILGLATLGYKPHQFSYDTRELVRSREQLPAARLQVTRAERALGQFKDDARREGIAPGWLR
jgi:hypothetical protein